MTNWHIEQNTLIAPHFLNTAYKSIKIDVIRIHLVDTNDASKSKVPRFVKNTPRIYFDTGLRVNNDNGCIDTCKRTNGLSDEVRVTRGIDDIVLFTTIIEANNG